MKSRTHNPWSVSTHPWSKTAGQRLTSHTYLCWHCRREFTRKKHMPGIKFCSIKCNAEHQRKEK